MNRNIFDESDGSDNDVAEFKTNENYAKSYKYARKRELLQKYKDKGMDLNDSDENSDSDSSSEEDEVLDPKFDEEFFNTLASLKSKNPTIYDQNTRFFEATAASEEMDAKAKKKDKPISLKEYERKVLLETEGRFSDEDMESEQRNPFRAPSPTIVQEEQLLKEEFKKVVNASDDDDEEFGGVFKKREKSKEQHAAEEADYIKWLAGKEQEVQPKVAEKLKPLKNYWSNNQLPRNEKFLRDYILNKGYADTRESDIPTYEEIVGEEDPLPLSEDEVELEKQEEFEHKFNFRFEEPDTEFIKRYPRTIESTVRRTDDRRKEKRYEIKERKEAEKAQKMKELEMVKELKRKEIEEKIRKLKMVTGNEELGIRDEELEEDFDPEAHDRRMQELFNDNYYAVDEGEEKPECPSDIEELKTEDWDDFDPAAADNVPHCEDDDFNMDCEFDGKTDAKQQLQEELIENTRGRKGRKGRRRNAFMDMIRADKPRFDPANEKNYEDYLEEYYKLDCEDFIGDLPCRFKYVETTPNDFGLSIEEILLAKNKELNKWASLKKAIQIRPEALEKKEARLFRLKAKNEDLKRKIFKSLYGEGSDEDNSGGEEDKGELETHSNDNKATVTKEETKESNTVNGKNATKNKKKRKRRKAQQNGVEATENPTTAKKANNETTKNPTTANKETIEKSTTGKKANKETTEKSTTAKKANNETTENPTTSKNSNKETTEKSTTGKKANKETTEKSTTGKKSNKAETPAVKAAVKRKNPFGGRSAMEQGQSQYQIKGRTANFKTSNKKPKHNDGQLSNDRFKAYGINPRKFQKQQKYGKKDE